MEQKHFHFNEKKRVVVKIGSSSLNYGETGNLNFTKLEHLVRELCNLRNRGMDVCLVSSGAIAVGRQTLGMDERPKDISTKQACAAVGQARLMMIRDNVTAAGAAARVGYESASQFNREFKRLFGRSPGEETRKMRTAFALMEPAQLEAATSTH